MKRYLAALLVVLGVVGVVGVVAVGGRGFADDENGSGAKCSEATLHGTYLFAFDGVEIKGNDQIPFALAGYDVFDGNGHFKEVASTNFNGQVIIRKEHTSGTYNVKADCTGTGTAAGTQFDMFIAPDGSKFTFVIIKPKAFVASGFEERATAKRVGP